MIAPLATMMAPMLLELPISALFSYVVDRIFGSANDDAMREALATNRELVQVFDNTIAGRDDSMNRVLDMLQQSMDRGQELSNEVINLQARLISDQERRLQLNENKEIFRKISEEKEAELITMAAPLLKEMNVPLRKSSSSLQVRTKIGSKYTNIIIADKNMADSVNIAVVDKQKTIIDINIVQFNKQTGWGKFENPEWEGQPSFSVPGDILDDFKETIVNSMNADLVSVECLFVRSPAGIPQRIIMTDLWPAKD